MCGEILSTGLDIGIMQLHAFKAKCSATKTSSSSFAVSQLVFS